VWTGRTAFLAIALVNQKKFFLFHFTYAGTKVVCAIPEVFQLKTISIMKAMRNLGKIMMIAFGGAIILYACSKESSGGNSSTVPAGKQQVNLYLTDGPSFFDSVKVDIKSVKFLVDTCDKSRRHHDDDDTVKNCGVWDSVSIAPGVYNLLNLRNGIDTLLASGNLTDGSIRKIVITLGSNNSLVKDSVTYPLHLLSNQIVIRLNGNEWENFQTGKYRLWLDFDCGRSIIRLRDGEFYLNPFIHAFIVKETGVVKGIVKPFAAWPVITVYNGTDTAYALPFGDGQFKVRGLKTGTYSVFVNTSNGYKDTTITNVSVTVGKDTDLGTITLHK
jgi:hypothetical protein